MKALQRLAGFALALATIVAAVGVFTPFAPHMPAAGLDESWEFGLNWALAHGLVFGRDVIFTFGPYAAVFTHEYQPSCDALLFWSAFYLGLSTGAVAVALVSDRPLQYRAAVLLAVVCLIHSGDAALIAYPVLAGAYSFRFPAALEPARPVWSPVTLAALVFPFGLLDLVKGTMPLLCGPMVLAMCVRSLTARRPGDALAMAAAFAGSHLVFWLLAGQPAGALPSFFIAMIPLVQGYSEAMAIDGVPVNGMAQEPIWFVLAALAVLAAALVSEQQRQRWGLLLIVVALPLFVTFKDAFVRHDGHAIQAPVALLLMSTVVLVVNKSAVSLTSYVASLVAALVINSHYDTMRPANIAEGAGSVVSNTWRGLAVRIAHPEALPQAYAASLARVRAATSVPAGLVGPTDTYANDQVGLVAAGDQWDPRPVFQSYTAYLPSLLEANQRHLAGQDAPRNLVFDLAAIDERLPSLEDGASWTTILADYAPQTLSGNDLVLTRRRAVAPQVADLGAASPRLGESVATPAHTGALFVKLDIQPSLRGSLAGLAYRTSRVFVTVKLVDGETHRFRMIPGIAEAGFLLSPLVTASAQMALLYGPPSYLAASQVTSFSVDTDGRADWDPVYRVEFSQLAVPPAQQVTLVTGLAAPTAAAANQVAGVCQGNIEAMKATLLPPATFSTTAVLAVQGWMAASDGSDIARQQTFVVLTGADGRRWFFPTRRFDRPDVAQVFKDPRMLATGFTVQGDASQLPDGAYTIGLAYAVGDKIAVCPQFATPVTL